MQWVISLDYEVGTEKLTAATESAVFIIDTHVSLVLEEPYSVPHVDFMRSNLAYYSIFLIYRNIYINRALPTLVNTRPLLLGRCVCLYALHSQCVYEYLNCTGLFSSLHLDI